MLPTVLGDHSAIWSDLSFVFLCFIGWTQTDTLGSFCSLSKSCRVISRQVWSVTAKGEARFHVRPWASSWFFRRLDTGTIGFIGANRSHRLFSHLEVGCLQVFNKSLDACLICAFLFRLFTIIEFFGWWLESTISSIGNEVSFTIYICFLLALRLAEVLACLWCILELACRVVPHLCKSHTEVSLSQLLPLLISRGLVYESNVSERLVDGLRICLPDWAQGFLACRVVLDRAASDFSFQGVNCVFLCLSIGAHSSTFTEVCLVDCLVEHWASSKGPILAA